MYGMNENKINKVKVLPTIHCSSIAM